MDDTVNAIFDGCWVSVPLSLVGLGILLAFWSPLIQIFRGFPTTLVLAMLRFRLRSVEVPRRLWYLLAPLLAIPVAIVAHLYFDPHWTWLLALVLLSLAIASSELSPPCVLFLGSSSSSFDVNLKLISGFFPWKVASLLEPRCTDVPTRLVFDDYCLRTESDEEWRHVVTAICRYVPLVVIDVRHVTPYVLEECRFVLNESMHHKTVFIVPRDGHASAVASLFSSTDLSTIVMVYEDGIVAAAKSALAGIASVHEC